MQQETQFSAKMLLSLPQHFFYVLNLIIAKIHNALIDGFKSILKVLVSHIYFK